jgi:hypothetical protein
VIVDHVLGKLAVTFVTPPGLADIHRTISLDQSTAGFAMHARNNDASGNAGRNHIASESKS